MQVIGLTNRLYLMNFLSSITTLGKGDFLISPFFILRYNPLDTTENLPTGSIRKGKVILNDFGYQIITYISKEIWKEVYPKEAHLYANTFHIIDIEAINQNTLVAILDSAKKNMNQLVKVNCSLLSKLVWLYKRSCTTSLSESTPSVQIKFRNKYHELSPCLAKLVFSNVFKNFVSIPFEMTLSQFYKVIDSSYEKSDCHIDTFDKVLNLMFKGMSFDKINLVAEQILGE